MSEVVYTVLDVGQGTGNFVQVYNGTYSDSTPPDYTVLIDLGSSADNEIAGGPSVDYVAARLNMMSKPMISVVILSHSDIDHVNLLTDLLGKFNYEGQTNPDPKKKTLVIGEVYYGGDKDNYTKNRAKAPPVNYIDKLIPYTAKDKDGIHQVYSFAPAYSSFNELPPRAIVVGDLHVMMLYANAVKADGTTGKKRKADSLSGYALNTVSIVALLSHGTTRQHIATGDATAATLQSINVLLKKDVVSQYLPNVFHLTVPHHGSDKTLYDLTGSKRSKGGVTDAKAEIKEFVDKVKAKAISVGATQTKRVSWNHPAWEVLNDLSTHIVTDGKGDLHYFRAWFGVNGIQMNAPSKAGFYTLRTAKAIFTTDYCRASQPPQDFVTFPPLPPVPGSKTVPWGTGAVPPQGVTWGFGTKSDGTEWIKQIQRRASAMALRLAIARGEDEPRMPHWTDFEYGATIVLSDEPTEADDVAGQAAPGVRRLIAPHDAVPTPALPGLEPRG